MPQLRLWQQKRKVTLTQGRHQQNTQKNPEKVSFSRLWKRDQELLDDTWGGQWHKSTRLLENTRNQFPQIGETCKQVSVHPCFKQPLWKHIQHWRKYCNMQLCSWKSWCYLFTIAIILCFFSCCHIGQHLLLLTKIFPVFLCNNGEFEDSHFP